MLFLGIDIGTTGAKAAVFDEAGTQYGYGFSEYGFSCPSPGMAEQDGEEIWRITKKVIKDACRDCGKEVVSLCLSVQGDAITAVDASYRPLLPFQLGMDYRCAPQALAFTQEYGAESLFRRTGMHPHPMNSICKIRHITEKCPDIAEKAYKFMTYSDFILAKLGADSPVIDETMAGRTMAMDLFTHDWIPEILQSAGIRREQLSSPVPSGSVVGRLNKPLAEEIGIRPGAFLTAGGHDQAMAALGAGLIRSGQALDSHGTAEVISAPLTVPKLDGSMIKNSFPCYFYAIPGMYFTFSLNHTAGVLLKWWADGFCRADADSASESGLSIYSCLTQKAGNAPSRLLVLPSFNGSATPECDLDARGAILGLTTSTTRHEIAKAIIEALCFNMKENLIALQDCGIGIEQLKCVGGGARSPFTLQMKADICGRPVQTLKVREAACLGAAMLAGVAAGGWASPHEAAGIVRTDREYIPNEKNRRLYEDRFSYYLEAAKVNREIFHYLARQ